MEHGPGMHGPALIVVLAIAVVGGLFYVVKSRRRSDRSPDPSERSPDSGDASERENDVSDRSPAP